MMRFLLALLFAMTLHAEEVITYELSDGRFGDNLLSYLHAKWISHEKKIPLLYKPFTFSNELIKGIIGIVLRVKKGIFSPRYET